MEEEAEKGEGIGRESSIEEQDEELEDEDDEQGGCF